MRPQPPSCGNRFPYCTARGKPMECKIENEREYVFVCPGCKAVNILTRPEYRAALRQQVARQRASGPIPYQRKYF